MIPIQDLLHRIQWDPAFGRGTFVIGYYDRVRDSILHIPMREAVFDPSDHFAFQVLDEEGMARSIPFHRIRQVFRDGALIWSRPPG